MIVRNRDFDPKMSQIPHNMRISTIQKMLSKSKSLRQIVQHSQYL